MEEITQRMKPGKVSFKRQPSKNSRMNERLEKINEVNVMELSLKEQPGQSESECSLDYPKSPYHAMEFLSRTWSPSSDDFFKLFSVNNLLPRLEDKDDKKEEHEQQRAMENEAQIQCIQADQESNIKHKKTWPVHEREHQIGKMKLGQLKSWLSRELLKNILKVSQKRRKEELRLHVSQVNAALSVANLAAAISGILANCTMEPNKHGKNMMNMVGGGHEERDQMKMNSVLASAAALIATVCVETAESVGAQRAHISSAITSGLQTRTSADMLDLAANAATSLRGVATLEKRAASKLYLSDDQKMLSSGSKLLIRTPAGKVGLRRVRIYLKHSKLILLLGKKLMGGFITTCKEYRIIDIMEDREGGAGFTEDEGGMYFVAIATSEGTIKLLFQDEKQFKAWKSSISHLLFTSHGSCKSFS